MKRKTNLFSFTLFLLLLSLVLLGCQANSPSDSDPLERIYNADPQRAMIGREITSALITDLVSEKTIDLKELSREKIVIMESFSVGCPACLLPLLGLASLTTVVLKISWILKSVALVLLIGSIYVVIYRQQKSCRVNAKIKKN